MDPTCVFNFFTFFERILYKSNCIIFISSWCATHTKIRSKLVVIVTAGSQKITLWGPQRTPPLVILRVKMPPRATSGILPATCVLSGSCLSTRIFQCESLPSVSGSFFAMLNMKWKGTGPSNYYEWPDSWARNPVAYWLRPCGCEHGATTF